MNLKLLKMKSIQTLVFDLETLPGYDKPTRDELSPPKTLKKPESIEAWLDDPTNLENEYAKQALNPYKGRILSVAWRLDDEPMRSVTDADDKKVLEGFQEQLQEQFRARFGGDGHVVHPVLIAFNGRAFDIPFLWIAIMKHNMEWLINMIGEDPDNIRYKDPMMTMGVTNAYKTMVSLEDSCRAFGLEGKLSSMSGADVFPYFKAGRLAEIDAYCRQDTEALYGLCKKLKLVR